MMQQRDIPADAPIEVTLTAAQWNAVLGVLQEGPYRIVAPLIAEIMRQAQAGAGHAQMESRAGLQEPRPNGEDRHA